MDRVSVAQRRCLYSSERGIMMAASPDDRGWNPYFAGALCGVLIAFTAVLTGNYFGASASFVRAAGMIEGLFDAERVSRLGYFARFVPHVDWQWFLLVGIVAGALASSLRSRDFAWRGVPDMWERRFGTSRLLRAAHSFAGGFVMLVGARIAGG
jgi:hypothetical protein